MKFKDNILPIDIKERIAYLYRLNRLLIDFHNEKGKEYKDGKITLSEFRDFQEKWFNPRFKLISKEICNCKNNLCGDENILVSADAIEED